MSFNCIQATTQRTASDLIESRVSNYIEKHLFLLKLMFLYLSGTGDLYLIEELGNVCTLPTAIAGESKEPVGQPCLCSQPGLSLSALLLSLLLKQKQQQQQQKKPLKLFCIISMICVPVLLLISVRRLWELQMLMLVYTHMFVCVRVLAVELTYFSTFNIYLDFDRP